MNARPSNIKIEESGPQTRPRAFMSIGVGKLGVLDLKNGGAILATWAIAGGSLALDAGPVASVPLGAWKVACWKSWSK